MLYEIKEAILLSFEALRSNKLRSFLASLGVVIGISIVIMMGWLLGGLDKAMQDTFSIIGTDMLFVDKWDWTGSTNWKNVQYRKDITLKQAEQLKTLHGSAEYVIPNVNAWGVTVQYDNEVYQGMTAVGTTAENGFTSVGNLLMGRYFNEFEEEYGSNVIVIGYMIYETVFKGENPIGKIIKLNGKPLRVIGVVKKRGTMFFDFIDRQMFLPLKRFSSIWSINNRSLSIGVKAGLNNNLDEVRAETIGLMRIIRNLKPGENNDFSINETKAFEKSIQNIKLTVYTVGIVMTSLAFIVGIIGIMNIMFVTVTERTKEIGIRKSLGAKKRSIWLQFLIESSFLCFIGALLSLLICSVIAYLAATYLPQFYPALGFLLPTLPTELFIIAAIVSIVVGLLAGLIPAIRAANLNPVEALRFD
ncbi:FtsX-like permease family protein [bacterium]|nr:MAG: FtsX-like permease family protein [bacterium]